MFASVIRPLPESERKTVLNFSVKASNNYKPLLYKALYLWPQGVTDRFLFKPALQSAETPYWESMIIC
jgi:hypothetical protein